MALTKSQRILILLGIDLVFFFIELIVGAFYAHSLALVADSFHMLNDVLSLCVGYWAVKVAASKKRSKMYTYGWQRAETVGALINGVFLVALCVSIILEALQRFIEPQEVTHPQSVLIVGCCGLASNILGLFLFHGHGHPHAHSHGDDGHGHSNGDSLRTAEEGREHVLGSQSTIADESGNIEDVLPENRVRTPHVGKSGQQPLNVPSHESRSGSTPTLTSGNSTSPSTRRVHRRTRSRTYSTLDDIAIHPASLRNDIISAGRLNDVASETDDDVENEDAIMAEPSEESPLLKHSHSASGYSGNSHNHKTASKPKESESKKNSGHGHSHDDLNMRGVFLHVMGDALGNIGVIGAALFIWLSTYSWRFYSDPAISLVISIIILTSAWPLCKAASRILLQAAPVGLNVDDVKESILALPGVVGCHHLHVWQLSDTTMVATLHVRVKFNFEGEGSQEYMTLAGKIRKCLHSFGIHSSTIQPEFCSDEVPHRRLSLPEPAIDDESCDEDDSIGGNGKAASKDDEEDDCLLSCPPDCQDESQCCPTIGSASGSKVGSVNKGSKAGSRVGSKSGSTTGSIHGSART